MKAIFFEKHGEIDVLKHADLPDPKPKPGEALVKVKAVALNHLDIWVRRGWPGLRLDFPHITGSDIAGEIVSVSGDYPGWKAGRRVVINPGILTIEDEYTRSGQDSLSPGYRILGEHIKGGLAEYLTVPVENLFTLADDISFIDGAAPLLVATTCWRMLFSRAQIMPGESLLVVGSGGGVNSLTILLAKAVGVTVFALAGGKDKVKKAEALGADYVLDYLEHPNWHAEILKLTLGRGIDVIIDNVGSKTITKSIKACARGGRIITVGNTKGYEINFDNRLLFTKQVSIIGSTMGSRKDFASAIEFLWRKNIKIPIDTIGPLADGIKLIQKLETGTQFGKIVLSL